MLFVGTGVPDGPAWYKKERHTGRSLRLFLEKNLANQLFVGTGVPDGPAQQDSKSVPLFVSLARSNATKDLLRIVKMVPDRSFAFAQDDKKIITGQELFPPCCGNIVVNMTIPE